MSDHYITAADLAAANAPPEEHEAHPSPLHVVTIAMQSLATTDGDLRKRSACALHMLRTGVRAADVPEDCRPLFADLMRAYAAHVDEVSTTPLRLDVDVATFTLRRAQSIAEKICELHVMLLRALFAARVGA